MGRKPFSLSAILLLLALAFFGCTVVPEAEAPPDPLGAFDFASLSVPQGFAFRAEAVPDTAAPPEAGAKTSGEVVAAFVDAWRAAVLQGIPLAGVLGGDRVHPWPETNPQCLAQNWRALGGAPNSWGLPTLVMALQGAGRGAYLISGAILDAYGKNRGTGLGNGVEGYGYPLGNPYYRDGKIVQEFSKGVFVQDGNAAVFTAQDADLPAINAAYVDGIPGEVSEAFAEAKMPYRAASDAPLAYIRFQSAWDYEAAGEKKSILVAGLYLETLSQGKYVFVLPDSPDLPRRAVLVKGDFLSAILTSHERLPGAEALAPSPPEKIQSAFSSALLAGFALYGVPLTDEMPYAAEGGLTRAQRFARGWIIAD